MRQWLATAGLIFISVPALAINDVPVEDYSESAYEVEQQQPEARTYASRNSHSGERLSMSERMSRLENKVDNLTSMNLSSKVEELQQTIQELRGQLEKQAHDMEVLSAQQKSYSQDVSGKIASSTATSEAVVPSTVDAPSAAAAPAATPKSKTPAATDQDQSVNNDEHQAYRQAFALLKSKQYDQALTQFQAYLKNYPKGHYRVNAYYWVGEMNYLQGNHKEAKKAFEKVATQYPGNDKIPDALLKLAIIDIDTGHKQKAAATLAQIQQKYPGTSAARLAMMRSQELKLSKR